MTHLPACDELLSEAEFERRLRAVGAERYHNLHPFHKMLHGGDCTLGQMQAWALNRYCYQAAIPRKDAALMSRVEDRDLRRIWIQRMHDHDGWGDDPGGIERWFKLTDGLGLDRDYVASTKGALPATKFAVEAYVRYVVETPQVVAVSSCLTELFAPAIHAERIAGMLANYDFIGEDVLAYFRKRLDQAPRDAAHALEYVKRECRRRDQQEAVIAALVFKTDVLWAQLDALYFAYVTPGMIPPGAFRPEVP